jgi:LPXTG-site transpeptidase (sortase) family protein
MPVELPARPDRRRVAPFDPGLLVGSTDAEVLQGFVDLVRAWRGEKQGRALPLRGSDVAALVAILGTDSAEVERRLVAATACSPGLARHGRRLLLASVGVLALGLVAAPHIGGASTAAEQAQVVSGPEVAAATVVRSTPFRGSPAQMERAGQVGVDAERAIAVEDLSAPPAGALVEEVEPVHEVPAAPAPATVPAGAEAVVAIASVGLELPVVLGGQSVIDQGHVAHYTAPGWEDPVPAGAPGTYWLAAHATTHGAPFRSLPDVAVGAEIRLDTGSQTFLYTVTSTQVTGLYPGDDLMYGTDPTASVILLQTCIDDTRRLLVHGTLTATR